MYSAFSHFNPAVKAAYYVAAALVLAMLLATLLSALFQRTLYRRRYLPRYNPSYQPRCAIILPVKGIPKGLEQNMQAYARLDYPDYQVIVCVESENDPAVAVVMPVVEQSPRMSLVVAGMTKSCAQKNHNMLAAIKKAESPEVYVFADADIAPTGHWLRDLVIPLSSKSLTATTGFRWLISQRASLGELTHTNVNTFFLVLFGFVSLLGLGSICWGGSMAIRKKDFDELKVAEKWARSGVDDISLASVLTKNRRKSILVPTCITRTNDLIETSGGTIDWCARQVMFLKVYHRPLWFFGLGPLWIAALVLHALLPVALVTAAVTGRNFFALGGGASLLFLVGDMLTVLLYPLMGPIPRFHRLFLFQFFFRTTHIISYAKTLFAKSIVWSGFRYTLAFSGDVTRVERLDPQG